MAAVTRDKYYVSPPRRPALLESCNAFRSCVIFYLTLLCSSRLNCVFVLRSNRKFERPFGGGLSLSFRVAG